MARIPDSLRALLENLIDYAGLYPPAGLPIAEVLENYQSYRESPAGWMLNRLVLPAAKLPDAPLRDGWRVTLLVDGEPGPLPPQIETLETKLASRLSLPTYCETALDAVPEGAYAKVRTGGLTPDAIPAPAAIADFLCTAAQLRKAFKATAGLHHPLRSMRPLTYAVDTPRATMHGFVNVFAAAAFAWQGEERAVVLDVLSDGNPESFRFLEGTLRWNSQAVATPRMEAARRAFAHSFGSCSFTEPVADLQALGWLD
ncbi:MAG TPA: hypothetical protein VMU80_18355 [Bryobacteraceae bacterium]|nr:hypothetical protein [Bryobacteraceae bacterium]